MGILYLRDRCLKVMSKIVWMSWCLEMTLSCTSEGSLQWLRHTLVFSSIYLCRIRSTSVWAQLGSQPPASGWEGKIQMSFHLTPLHGLFHSNFQRICRQSWSQHRVEWWLPSSSQPSQRWRHIIWRNDFTVQEGNSESKYQCLPHSGVTPGAGGVTWALGSNYSQPSLARGGVENFMPCLVASSFMNIPIYLLLTRGGFCGSSSETLSSPLQL